MTSNSSARTFLVVVDDSPEMMAALRYACMRARKTKGRVALLRVIEPIEFQQFATIGNLMRDEARLEAEDLLEKMAADVNDLSGDLPILYVREGHTRDELLALIDSEPSISVLVLAAGSGPEGPGPLISALTGKHLGKLRIPITILPGNLTEEQIAALS